MPASKCYFATLNGDRTGRAGHFFADEKEAGRDVLERNVRARALGVSFNYAVSDVLDNTLTGSDRVR